MIWDSPLSSFLTLALICILCPATTIIPVVSATIRYVGIAEGQSLHYKWDADVLSGNDTELISHMLFYHGWINITVQTASANSITYNLVIYNDTTVKDNMSVSLNVETGESNSSALDIYPIIAANLGVGDAIYTDGLLDVRHYIINETIMANYFGFQRETNCLILHGDSINVLEPGDLVANQTVQVDWYWDKVTGVIVQFVSDMHINRSDGGSGVLVTHWETEISILDAIPSIPELPSFIILPMLAAILAVTVYRRKQLTTGRRELHQS
jgi:hypothetical protein